MALNQLDYCLRDSKQLVWDSWWVGEKAQEGEIRNRCSKLHTLPAAVLVKPKTTQGSVITGPSKAGLCLVLRFKYRCLQILHLNVALRWSLPSVSRFPLLDL